MFLFYRTDTCLFVQGIFHAERAGEPGARYPGYRLVPPSQAGRGIGNIRQSRAVEDFLYSYGMSHLKF